MKCMKNLFVLAALMSGVAGYNLIVTDRAQAQSVAILDLYDFSGGNDGANPGAGLTLAGGALFGTAEYGGSSGDGSLFAINTNGGGFTAFYSFSATDTNGFNGDGAYPIGGLILSGTTLYGTASLGGNAGNGTVFSVSTNGSGFAALHTFSPLGSNGFNSDGAEPEAGLALSSNTLYGTALIGGSSGSGTVFSVKTNGAGFATLYSFQGGNDGGYPYSGLVLAGNTLYGTVNAGGSSGNGAIFALNTDGTGFTTLYSFSGTDANGFNNDGSSPVAGLILSGGALYGTAEYGGGSGNGTVFSISTNGAGFAALYSFSALDTNSFNSDGANPAAALMLSGDRLYGTAEYGGSSGNGTVFSVNTNGTGFAALSSFPALDANNDNSGGANPLAGLLLSGNTLYGTATDGGASGAGAVFSLAAIFDQITAAPAVGAAPLTVNFTSSGNDSLGNAITNWNWNFGDGSISTAQSPSHTYILPGNYTPTLLATNTNGVLISESGPSITVSGPNVAYTANPIAGVTPLNVRFMSAAIDSASNAIVRWNWNFGDGSTSTAQNPAHTYTNAGIYTPTLVATNSLGAAIPGVGPASIPSGIAPVYSGVVLNGGFETGDFTGWTLGGLDTNDMFVDTGSQSGIHPQSGSYLAALGSSGSLGYLSQTLATTPGTAYSLSFWLDSPDGSMPNEFLVSWNGVTLWNRTNLPAMTGWTNLQFAVTATGTSTVLQFGSRDDSSFLGLDDISVLPPQPGGVTFNLSTFSQSGANLVLTGTNAGSGATYRVLGSANIALPLSQWTPVATNALGAGGNFTITITNAVTTRTPQQFYILQEQ